MRPLSRNYNELLHNSPKIFKVITQHLKKPNSLALEAILNVTTLLSKDLRVEFYKLFKTDIDLFNTLIELIDPLKPEETELIFQSLAYIFKYLSKNMIQDLPFWFENYSVLIGSKKWFIRRFSAESFSFLIQKLQIEEMKIYFEKTFEILSKSPSQMMYDGTSLLFFETMKGVYGHFHSTMPKILPILFRNLDWNENIDVIKQETDLPRKFLLVQKSINLLVQNTLKSSVAETLWNCFSQELNYLIDKWNKKPNINLGTQIGHFAGLTRELCQKKDIIIDKILFEMIKILTSPNILHSKEISDMSKKAILDLIERVLYVYKGETLNILFSKENSKDSLMEVIYNIPNEKLVIDFFRIITSSIYRIEKNRIREYKNEFTKGIFQYLKIHMKKNIDFNLEFLVEFLKQNPKIITFENQISDIIIEILNESFMDLVKCKDLKQFIESDEEIQSNLKPHKIWACLIYFQNIQTFTKEDQSLIQKITLQLFELYQKTLKENSQLKLEYVKLLSEALITLTSALSEKDLIIFIHNYGLKIFQLIGKEPLILKSMDELLNKISNENFSLDFKSVALALKENLSSENNNSRIYTLKILNKIPGILMKNNTKCIALEFILGQEECELNWEKEREKLYFLHKLLDDFSRNGKSYDSIYIELLSHYILGGYFVKYSEVWPLIKQLGILLSRTDSQMFWNIFIPKLKFYHHLDLVHEESKEKSFIYRKEKFKVSSIKFNDYEKIFSSQNISLEELFSKFLLEPYEHTDYTQYFQSLWELVLDLRLGKTMFQDILFIFNEFIKVNDFKIQGLKEFKKGSRITNRMKQYLELFSRFDAKAYETLHDQIEMFQGLIITSNVEIQGLVLGILSKFNLPWLTPYYDSLKLLLSYQTKPSVFRKFPIVSIQKDHKKDLCPFIINLLTPTMKPQKSSKKSSLKEKIRDEINWKTSIKGLLEYFSEMDKNNLDRFVQVVFPTKDMVLSKKKEGKLKWVLAVMEEIVKLVGDSYSFCFDPMLDILLIIATRDISNNDIEDEEDEEDQSKIDDSMNLDEQDEKEVEKMDEEETDKMDEESDQLNIPKPEKKKLKKGINMLRQEIKKKAIELITMLFKRHDSFEFKPNHLEIIHNTFLFYSDILTRNAMTLPFFFEIIFSWDSTLTSLYLLHYEDYLPKLIQILKSEKLSPKVFNRILDYINALLSIKNEQFLFTSHLEKIFQKRLSKIKGKTIEQIFFVPLVNTIVEVFYHALSQKNQGSNKKIALFIIDALKGHFNKDTNPDILISLYSASLKSRNIEILEESLHIFKEYLPKSSIETKDKYIKIFSSIFISQSDVALRKSICEVFDKLGEQSKHKEFKLLYALNSQSSSSLDKADVESRMDAFNSIIKLDETVKRLDEIQLLPVIANLIFFIHDDQWLIRENSSKSLGSIMRLVGENVEKFPKAKEMIIENLMEEIKKPNLILKENQVVNLLSDLSKNFEEFKDFKSLSDFFILLSKDDDKKIQAFKKYKKLKYPEEKMLNIVVPLFYCLLLSLNQEIRKFASQILIDISKYFSWDGINKILNHLLGNLTENNQLTSKKIRSEILVLMCEIVEDYSKRKKSTEDFQKSKTFYISKIIPKLYENLWNQEEGNVVNLDVTLLIVKILKIYDQDQLKNGLSKIILEIIGKLKDKKNEKQRERSREVLIAIIKELGSEYFFFCIDKLEGMLFEGYMISILHYTIYGLLKALRSDFKDIDIDDTSKLLPVLLNILFKDLTNPLPILKNQNMKEKEMFYNYQLTYECINEISQLINPEKSLDFILKRIEKDLQKITDKEILSRYEKVLKALLSGLKMKEITEDFIFSYCVFKLKEKSLVRREFQLEVEDPLFSVPKKKIDQWKETFLIPEEPGRQGAISLNDKKRMDKVSKKKDQNDHLIFGFILEYLEYSIKKGIIKDEKKFNMLIEILVKYLSIQHSNISIISLRILVSLQKFNLPSIQQYKKDIINGIFEIILNTGIDSKYEIWDKIFSVLKNLLNQKVELSEKQLNILFDIIKIEVNGRNFNDKPFEILSHIVSKGIIVQQVYDIAYRIRTVLLISQGQIQQFCIQTLTNFFLNYPMTPEVLQDHLDFLFQNVMNTSLSFNAKSSLISMISTIIAKFPTQFINEKIEFLLFPLILSICNDDNPKSQKDLQKVTYELIRKISTKTFEKVVKLIEKWIQLDDKLKMVGTQLFSIITKVGDGEKILGYLDDLLPFIYKFITPQKGDQEIQDSPRLFIILSSLISIKNLYEFKKIEMDETLLKQLNHYLTSKYYEIKMITFEIYYFALKRNHNYFKNQELIEKLIHLFFDQLTSKNLNDENSIMILKNLVLLFKSKSITERMFEKLKNISLLIEENYDLKILILRRKTILTLFVTLVNDLNTKILPYLEYMLPLIFRIKEKKDNDIDNEILRKYTNEIIEMIKKTVGIEKFNEAYFKIESEHLNKKEQRKAKVAQEAIVDPVGFAQRIIEKREKIREKKKRKRKEERDEKIKKMKKKK